MTKSPGGNICHVTSADEGRGFLREIADGGRGVPSRRKRSRILPPGDRGREGGGRIDADIASVPGFRLRWSRGRLRAVRDGERRDGARADVSGQPEEGGA